MADEPYIELPIAEADYDAITGDALDYLTTNMPGWRPSSGHLEVWVIEAIARMVFEAQTTASLVPPIIFRYFGESLLAISAIDSASARMASTWTAKDTLGHTIGAGTTVRYVTADGPVYFSVENDVVIAPGQTTTSNGEVSLVALTPGSASNDLAPGVLYVVDALVWVDQVTSTETSAGGVDAESSSEYLDRLRSELRLLTPRPILPNDFAVLARRIPGVSRSFAIDGYSPTLGTYNNERVVTVAVADENGNAVGGSLKDQVASYLDAMREINFVVNVINPTFTDVNVTASLVALPGADSDEVKDAAELALEEYLNPATWEWSATVRKNEIIALLDRVTGVDYVDNVSVPTSNVTLSGAAPLARSGTLAITVTS